jgi:hypothetical protein
MQSTAHRIQQQQQAGVTHPSQQQAVDSQGVQYSHFELPLVARTDHSLVDLQMAGCIQAEHIQADQLLVRQHIPTVGKQHLHSWDQLGLPGTHSWHCSELIDHHHMQVVMEDTAHSHLADCTLVLLEHSDHTLPALDHPAVGNPVEHTHQVQLLGMSDHKQEVAELAEHKMQEVAPGKHHLLQEHRLWVAIVQAHHMEVWHKDLAVEGSLAVDLLVAAHSTAGLVLEHCT